ncbi:hypothetical protein CONLIGDRAFT_692465 [Coniochaeta ligniaria NRRL 30616]|uniref:Uncharacterized protein n=1 Tax=Coniochaeta ligniaria NRRL 30616 TaxID=1408157 RepID=A0A1J7J359_9PEZI|nr:hypothetical protein CONLIGDRAFT_692465 [Coniochaeta ligniaria NRRL 30616]
MLYGVVIHNMPSMEFHNGSFPGVSELLMPREGTSLEEIGRNDCACTAARYVTSYHDICEAKALLHNLRQKGRLAAPKLELGSRIGSQPQSKSDHRYWPPIQHPQDEQFLSQGLWAPVVSTEPEIEGMLSVNNAYGAVCTMQWTFCANMMLSHYTRRAQVECEEYAWDTDRM